MTLDTHKSGFGLRILERLQTDRQNGEDRKQGESHNADGHGDFNQCEGGRGRQDALSSPSVKSSGVVREECWEAIIHWYLLCICTVV